MKKFGVLYGATAIGALVLGGVIVANCSKDDSAKGGDKPEVKATPPPEGGKGMLTIDGSTTVYPIVSAAVEDFGKANPNIKSTVNKKGTGSGMKEFIGGEIDICTASRPIKKDEDKQLADKKIDYIEIPIAYDGVSIIVNNANTWLTDTKIDELKKAFGDGSTVKTWADFRAGFPADKVTFYGPTDNHGTYEYFTEAVNGKKGAIRKDYQANQEYTAIVNNVKSDKNGIAYVGYNYYAENSKDVKAVKVGGIAPSEDTIKDGSYTPLSRPLFIYVNVAKMKENAAVKSFVDYLLSDKGDDAVKEAKYVVLPPDTKAAIKAHVDKSELGSKFVTFKPGDKLGDLYKK